jgi:hypothetical protein
MASDSGDSVDLNCSVSSVRSDLGENDDMRDIDDEDHLDIEPYQYEPDDTDSASDTEHGDNVDGAGDNAVNGAIDGGDGDGDGPDDIDRRDNTDWFVLHLYSFKVYWQFIHVSSTLSAFIFCFTVVIICYFAQITVMQ